MATTRTARKPRAKAQTSKKKKPAAKKDVHKKTETPAEKGLVKVKAIPAVTVSALIKAAKGLDKASSSLWATAGLLIFQRVDKFKEGVNKDNMRETFLDILQSEHEAKDVPKNGMSQAGKVIELRHEDGTIKWRSWKVTGRLVQNTTEVFKAIEAGLDIWDKEGLIISRRKILDLLAPDPKDPDDPGGEGEGDEGGEEKDPEEAIATIQRSVTLIEQKFGELDKADLELAIILIEKLLDDLQIAS